MCPITPHPLSVPVYYIPSLSLSLSTPRPPPLLLGSLVQTNNFCYSLNLESPLKYQKLKAWILADSAVAGTALLRVADTLGNGAFPIAPITVMFHHHRTWSHAAMRPQTEASAPSTQNKSFLSFYIFLYLVFVIATKRWLVQRSLRFQKFAFQIQGTGDVDWGWLDSKWTVMWYCGTWHKHFLFCLSDSSGSKISVNLWPDFFVYCC